MRREISWVEKLPDRVKREVRVWFHGGKIYWKEKRSAGRGDVDASWDDAMQPSEEDWEKLREEVERRVQRRLASEDELKLVEKRVIGVKRGAPRQRFGREW